MTSEAYDLFGNIALLRHDRDLLKQSRLIGRQTPRQFPDPVAETLPIVQHHLRRSSGDSIQTIGNPAQTADQILLQAFSFPLPHLRQYLDPLRKDSGKPLPEHRRILARLHRNKEVTKSRHHLQCDLSLKAEFLLHLTQQRMVIADQRQIQRETTGGLLDSIAVRPEGRLDPPPGKLFPDPLLDLTF